MPKAFKEFTTKYTKRKLHEDHEEKQYPKCRRHYLRALKGIKWVANS
jgi:hypothetical protein